MGNIFSEESKNRLKAGAKKSAEIQKNRKKKYIEEYLQNPNICKECNNVIPYNKRINLFCSKSCSATNCNVGRTPNLKHGKWSKKKCKGCDKYTKNEFYCSNKCQKQYEWENTKKKIEETGITTSFSHSKIPKRYLLEKRGHKCEVCKGKEWMGKPIPLILDHIDGNSDNWELSNLQLVCGNCDMQLPTYKSKNKGNGRHWRRERYKEGKSY